MPSPNDSRTPRSKGALRYNQQVGKGQQGSLAFCRWARGEGKEKERGREKEQAREKEREKEKEMGKEREKEMERNERGKGKWEMSEQKG